MVTNQVSIGTGVIDFSNDDNFGLALAKQHQCKQKNDAAVDGVRGRTDKN